MAAGHVRRGPGLVDEDEALGIKVELPFEPLLALLDGMASLFLRVMP